MPNSTPDAHSPDAHSPGAHTTGALTRGTPVERGPIVRLTRLDAGVVTVVVLGVAAAAWLLLAYGVVGGHHDTAMASEAAGAAAHHGHHGDPAAASGIGPAAALSRVTGWTIMVVAMMLPPALPLLYTVRAITRRRATAGILTTLGGLAFALPWIGAGIALVAVDAALTASPAGGWLTTHAAVVTGSAAVAAGLYQFTPLKRACLTACRSPRQLALTEWHGDTPIRDVTRIGWRYGLVCVGCCWALMLLTLAVGWPALPVMVAMSAVMAAERLLPRIRGFVPIIALVAIAAGIALLTGWIPAGRIVGGP